MSKHSLPETPNSAARQFVKEVGQYRERLPDEDKELASIHPKISEIVETDTDSEDIGRIKDVNKAHEIALARYWALKRDSYYDEGKSEAEIKADMTASEAWYDKGLDDLIVQDIEDDYGKKAGQDYLITQGVESAMNARRGEIGGAAIDAADLPYHKKKGK